MSGRAIKSSHIGISLSVLIGVLVFIYQSGLIYFLSVKIGLVQVGTAALLFVLALGCFILPTGRAVPKLPVGAIMLLLVYALAITIQLAFVDSANYDIYALRFRFMISLVALIIILSRIENFDHILIFIRIALVFSVVANLLDFFVPSINHALTTLQPIKILYRGRASGLFSSPNIAGATIALATILSALGARRGGRLFFYLVGLFGVLATVSRGGLILWGGGVLLLELMHMRAGQLSKAASRAGVMILIITAVALVAQSYSTAFSDFIARFINQDTGTRLTTLQDDSARERMELIRFGLAQFAEKPIFGNGVGYSYQWDLRVPVHNVYVLLLVENGLFGIIWLALLIYSFLRFPRPVSIVLSALLLIKGVFNHNVFNELSDAIAIALFWRASVDQGVVGQAFFRGGKLPKPSPADVDGRGAVL